MKPRLLDRLNLLAAEQETQLLETIRRQNTALKQTDHQHNVLASYRDRLAASWQDGAPVPAAQARRAGQFSAASHGAEAQIDHAAQLAAERLELALADLAQVQARRRALGDASTRAARQAERTTEQRQERDLSTPRSIFRP
jgi:flagellar biosynthesis chaperone FliJ